MEEKEAGEAELEDDDVAVAARGILIYNGKIPGLCCHPPGPSRRPVFIWTRNRTNMSDMSLYWIPTGRKEEEEKHRG